MKTYYKYLAVTAIALLVVSCKNRLRTEYTDDKLKYDRKTFEEKLFQGAEAKDKINESLAKSFNKPNLPKLTPLLLEPEVPSGINNNKLISLAVTEDIPLRDILFEIGRMAELDVEIDPNISGSVLLRVTDKPLEEVLQRISEMASLRYTNINGILRIERDLPYVENYSIDFMNLVRSKKSNISMNVGLGGSVGSGSSSSSSSSSGSAGSQMGAGSASSITSEYEGDLWKSIETDVKTILETGKTSDSKTSAEKYLTINKQAGIITVKANSREQKSIAEYLRKVKRSVSAQVLIEAKIVEVELNDEFRTGINWQVFANQKKVSFGDILGTSATSTVLSKTVSPFILSLPSSQNSDIYSNIQLMNIFGTTRTLSSPRLHAMNNQHAVLSFAKNEVYFTLEIDSGTTTSSTSTSTTSFPTVTSTLNTVPIGIMLSLQPSIDLDNQEITMNVRPTITRSVGTVTDPGVQYTIELIKAKSSSGTTPTLTASTIPVVEVKELDSIIKIKSGDVMVIGGMMEDRNENVERAVPVLGKLPVMGNLFKNVSQVNQVVETVIFIKATIMPTNSIEEHDKTFYKNFTRDPNPLKFNN